MRGHPIHWTLLLVVGVAAAGATAMMATAGSTKANNGTVDVSKTNTLGTVLVAANGHALYRYTVDSKGVNRCSNVPACNTYWPALLIKNGTKPTAGAGASAKLLGTINAAHGMRQVTYAGFPLYYFSGDKTSGQTNGQGFERKWYVVATNGAVVQHTVKATATNSGTTTAAPATTATAIADPSHRRQHHFAGLLDPQSPPPRSNVVLRTESPMRQPGWRRE